MLTNIKLRMIGLGLIPFDLILKFFGPRYTLFYWFFKITPPPMVAWVSGLRAVRASAHAARKVPAYRDFLKSNGATLADATRLDLPLTDKENYIRPYPPEQRCLNGKLTLARTAIDESSGSTGTPYNWIRSLEERRVSHTFISHFAKYCYGSTGWITINAFSMGAWATGVNMGIALQHNSIVKNTGPNMDKIFDTLEYFGSNYRYLICGYPPFLKHMIDIAAERGFPLGDYRLMTLLGGEGNSEGLRDYLLTHFRPVYSGYGATDIEIGIAGETPQSVAIRREARYNERLRKALFGNDSRLPMIFQYNPLMHHITVNELGELVFTITRLNILTPRIMCNIHDEGGVATHAQMDARCRAAGVDLQDLASNIDADPFRLPFLWIYGRKDSTVSVMGSNIYPEDLEQCLYDEPDLAALTHSFCLQLQEEPGGSVEVRSPIDEELQRKFDERIVERLRSLNADFREAMQEYEETVTPVIRLYSMGSGPFAGDAAKIKQTRILKPPGGGAVASRNPGR